MRNRWIVAGTVLLVAVGIAGVSSAAVTERSQEATLTVRLLGLPVINIESDPSAKLSVNTDDGSIAFPAGMFRYRGTLVPDFGGIPYTDRGMGTNLDTRVLKSVRVSLSNRAGTFQEGGFNPFIGRTEFGGNMPLTGQFRLRFKPFIKKEGGVLVTKTPEDMTIPAWVFGQRKGHAERGEAAGNGENCDGHSDDDGHEVGEECHDNVDDGGSGAAPPANTAMKLWYLGRTWRTGAATTFLGSVTASQLPTATPHGSGIDVRSDFYQNPANGHLQWDRDGGRLGAPISWTQGDRDGYGNVKVVTPVAIHHLEEHSQLKFGRFYTLLSFAELQVMVLPVEGGLSFNPEPRRSFPTLAAAVLFAGVGVSKRRRPRGVA